MMGDIRIIVSLPMRLLKHRGTPCLLDEIYPLDNGWWGHYSGHDKHPIEENVGHEKERSTCPDLMSA